MSTDNYKNYWQGELVRLRMPEPKDVEKIVENYRLNPDTEAEWLADELHLPRSVADCRKHWERMVSEPPNGDECSLIICTTDGNYAGTIGIHNTSQRHGGFSYGLSLLPEYRGRGYATEAMRLLLDYYFNHLRYHRCGTHIYDFNPRSARFHEKLGFRKCGELNEAHFFEGKYHNSLLYEMTADMFNGIYGNKT
ncbi:SPBc2 prophage-derived uncharacterized N-acetyltransferase YokL [Clostridia bacterium]|nr:SPBc2 prophage-derived uncharacterized N-acetyltransferase YokL [Clostridia bacterium]